jgi:hypothetical protein
VVAHEAIDDWAALEYFATVRRPAAAAR